MSRILQRGLRKSIKRVEENVKELFDRKSGKSLEICVKDLLKGVIEQKQ